jgi:gamma-glutamyltranspeptidase / glutathione hydrolase
MGSEWPVAGTQEFTTRPELAGTFGMVASTHWLASAAGMAVLEAGGNAFDAAVATGLVLQVVEPHLNGPGGEVPIIGYSAGAGGEFVIDGQGVAPAAATLKVFSDLGIDLVPGNGLLPAMVPGAFGAWMLLLQRYGTLPLREVMKYAIGYAGDGYPMLPGASATIEAMTETFTLHWPTSAEIYLADGTPAPGSRFANKVFADTYARVLAEAEAAGAGRDAQIEAARRAWYEGFVAEAIDDFAAGTEIMDVTGRPNRGLLRGSDLADWRASVEEPVRYGFRGLTVCKTGPWGQGPVFCQQLALLDGLGVDDLRPGSSALIHTVTEAAKLAFADREAWYGDPRHSAVPLDDLLSAGYTAERRRLVTDQASAELVPGAPGGRQPALPGYALAGGSVAAVVSGTGEPTLGEPAAGSTAHGAAALGSVSLGPGDTCHLDIADRFGNLVSATPSGGWLQSSPAVPGLGFCLGTRGQMFALTPGFASTLAPGRRPRSTLSPSLVLREGEPYMAFGTPGGDQQDQWTVGFFLNHAVYGMNLQQAIDFPAYHTDHFPSSFYPRGSIPRSLSVESRAGQQVVSELRARGHEATVSPPWSLGRISAVTRDRGFLHAAANPRGMQGYAVGR